MPGALDRDPYLLNCANGTIDLRAGRLRPHDPADYLTKLCPVAFDPDATCPMFERFMFEIFDGADTLIAYLQRLVGYWIAGVTTEHILPVLHGLGANGKSVLMTILFALLGEDYSGKAGRDLLMAVKGDRHPTALAWLHGKRLVAAIESGEGARLDEALVKELTGGDIINARRMREDPWQFSPTHKLVLVTNHKPRVKGTDHAIWRRLRLIPFNVTIPPERQDKQLADKLKTELPGILNWAVQGCLIWQQHGLQDPLEVVTATSEYRTEEDTLSAFVDDRCLRGPDYRAQASGLFAAYRAWAEDSGEKYLTSRGFCTALREKNYESYTSNGLWFKGIALNAFGKATE